MAEMIKENQFRLAIIVLFLAFFLGIMYLMSVVNAGTETFNDFIKNPLNWTLIILAFLFMKAVRPLVVQVWVQTSIRDDIELQTLIAQYLSNAKLMKELGMDVDKEVLRRYINKLMEECKK